MKKLSVDLRHFLILNAAVFETSFYIPGMQLVESEFPLLFFFFFFLPSDIL